MLAPWLCEPIRWLPLRCGTPGTLNVFSPMGHYLSIYDSDHQRVGLLRLGPSGAGPFLVEQWIAGYAISPQADAREAEEVRLQWIQRIQRTPLDCAPACFLDAGSREGLIHALQDDTDGCSWIRCRGLDNKLMSEISCPKLRALLGLWRMASTFDEWDAVVRVSTELVEAIEMSTVALEAVGAPWAQLCREAADLISGADRDGRIALG